MRLIKKEIDCGVEHPVHGTLSQGDEVYDHIGDLETAPPDIKILASYIIMRDYDWQGSAVKFVDRSKVTDVNKSWLVEIENILNFIKSSLHAQVGLIRQSKIISNN